MTELTDRRIFESQLVCTTCRKRLQQRDVADDTECRCYEETGEVRDFAPERASYLLEGAEVVQDIHLTRLMRTEPRGPAPERDGEALVDIPQRWVVHSDGFEWGYSGSGPSDLALNVLGLFVPPSEAWRLHQDYKFAVIAKIPAKGGTITAESVRDWLMDRWARDCEQEDA